MSPRRLLVVGASGFLGSNLATAARDQHEVIAHSSTWPVGAALVEPVVCDLADVGSGAALVEGCAPDLVVNCAALADVDACERQWPLAERLNAELPEELAIACQQVGVAFVHISTDAVFGAGVGPFTPASPPGPLNQYGLSKLLGEQRVLRACERALILRTNIVGWSPTGARSLLELFHTRLSRREYVPAFTDVFFRPVAANDLWPLIELLVEDGVHGVWHATGPDLISKSEFGRQVAVAFGFDPSFMRPVTVADAGLAATRARCLDVVPSTPPAALTLTLSLDSSLERLERLAASGYRNTLASFRSAAVPQPAAARPPATSDERRPNRNSP